MGVSVSPSPVMRVVADDSIGIVEYVGREVNQLRKGQRVVVAPSLHVVVVTTASAKSSILVTQRTRVP